MARHYYVRVAQLRAGKIVKETTDKFRGYYISIDPMDLDVYNLHYQTGAVSRMPYPGHAKKNIDNGCWKKICLRKALNWIAQK